MGEKGGSGTMAAAAIGAEAPVRGSNRLVLYVTMVYGPVAAVTFVVGLLFMREMRGAKIEA
jgi:hypothetical protein